jgi:cysteine desulfurase
VPRTIYFDYNATTPPDPAVRAAMQPLLEETWGNPSSVHQAGRRARARLDDARDRAAGLLRVKPSELIFTSGGTESNNLAIFGAARARQSRGKHLITSAIEHQAVLQVFDCLEQREGFSVTRLPVDSQGRVSADSVRRAVRPDTSLVSIMAANNEIGTLQPVAEIGAFCRAKGVVFHTDAVQWFGKEPVIALDQFNADLVSVCAHKFHGPKGAGLLYIRSPLQLMPLIYGGGQENELRGGTENVAGFIGLVEALVRFVPRPVFDPAQLTPLTGRLRQFVASLPGCELVSPPVHCLANTVSFVVAGADNFALLAGLDVEGVCASSGSACSAGALVPSHVVAALGKPALANSLVRFSLGRESSLAEVESVCSLLPGIIRRALPG